MTRISIFVAISILALVACVSEDAEETPPLPDGAERSSSELGRDPDPEVTPEARASLVGDNAAFAADLYRSVRAEGEGNFFFSPHSISIALAMAYGGSEGNTKRQMSEALHFSLPDDELHAAFNELDADLASRETHLDVINASWAQQGYTFLPSYLDLIAENYGAAMYLLDFAADPDASRMVVNDWVEERTAGRIVELLKDGDVSSYTRMILTNAIYFDAGWKTIFDEAETESRDFNLADGTTVSVPTMHMVSELRQGQGEGWRAVELPYNHDEMAMVAILPAEDRPDIDLELTPAMIDEVLSSLHEESVDLSLPRFSFGYDLQLVEHLQGLGMIEAFQEGIADFSSLDGTHELFIKTAVHQAFIEVTETGTEASAATAVVIDTRSTPPTLAFDRPFVFMIRDLETGATLFLGRVADPSAE